jgi:hypothetical protein
MFNKTKGEETQANKYLARNEIWNAVLLWMPKKTLM